MVLRPRSTGKAALVQFTSGSIGTPKGVHLTLDAVGAHVAAILAALEPGAGDSSCSWLPLSHDMGLIGMLLSPLAAGAPRFGHHRLTLMKPETFVANPASWLRTCSETGATITSAPNFALELAVRTSARAGSLDLSRLRALHRRVGVGPGRHAASGSPTRSHRRVSARWRSAPPTEWRKRRSQSRSSVPTSHGARSRRPADDAAGGGAASTLVSTGSPIDGVDVRVRLPMALIGPIEVRSRFAARPVHRRRAAPHR